MPRVNLSADEIAGLMDSFVFPAGVVKPDAARDTVLRDAADHPLLGGLVAFGADYLISGDKDKLALEEKNAILTPAAFWAKHG